MELAELRRLGVGSASLAAFVLGTSTAGAFCRTTTCDAADPQAECSFDAHGCASQGIPLAWPTQCISFGVQKDGSPLRHIDYRTFDGIVQTAFNQWTSNGCGSARPSFKMWDLGELDCGDAEFSKTAPNANTWMFRDKDWPYVGAASTLALTTITFELKSGTILDADVEVNSFNTQITTSDQGAVADLQSIATHEAGHFLGLAHSSDHQATMFASYEPGNLSFRTLGQDDQTAICTAYPPGRTTGTCSGPTPLNGFSRTCAADSPSSTSSGLKSDASRGGGCTVGTGRPSGTLPFAAVTLSAGLLGVALRRRRSQGSSGPSRAPR